MCFRRFKMPENNDMYVHNQSLRLMSECKLPDNSNIHAVATSNYLIFRSRKNHVAAASIKTVFIT